MVENEEREFTAGDGPIKFGNLKLLQLQITQTLGWLKDAGGRFEQKRDEKSRNDIQELTEMLLELLEFEAEWLRDVNAEASAMEDEIVALIEQL